MRTLLMSLFILTIFSLKFSMAAVSESDRAEIAASNRLPNAGFENGKSPWVASGGTFAIVTSGSNKLDGGVSGTWDSSSAAQTLTSGAFVVPEGLKGTNGLASLKIKTPSGVATHKLQVYDGTNVIAETQIQSSSVAAVTEVSFIFPSSGSIYLRLISVASNEPLISIDEGYLGKNLNISKIAQAQLIGTLEYAPAANCRWQLTTSSFSDYPTDSDCPTPTVTGQVQYAGSLIPGFKLNNVGPGTIKIVASGHFRHLSPAGNWPAFRFSDGTNFTSSAGFEASGSGGTIPLLEGQLTYSSAQSNVIIQIQQGSNSGSQSTEVYNEAGSGLHFDVYYFPSGPQTISNVAQSQSIYSGDLSFASGTSNATVFADINVTTPALGTVYLNQNVSAISAYASGLGITITPTQLGVHEICFDISFTQNTSAQNNSFVVYNGASPIGSIVTAQVNSGSDIKAVKPCGQFNVTSIAPVDLHVMFATSAGTMSLVSAGVNFKSISSAVNAPVLVGGVKSQAIGEENIFRLKFAGDVAQTTNCTTGTCATVDTNSTGSSASYAGPGVYDINFAPGLFTSAPSCTCNCGTVGVGPKLCYVDHVTATSSTAQASCYTPATMGAVDGIMTILCTGPK